VTVAVLEPVSVGLKFAFLVVLYLFLLWVVRSSLKDLRRESRPASTPGRPVVSSDATAMHSAAAGLGPERIEEAEALLRVETAPGLEAGSAFDLVGGAVLGRGDAVDIQLEDPFASTRHARISWEGSTVMIEDLGSTNGTYLNGEPLDGPQPLHVGDRIRIGDSEFSLAT
jgi:FHA domain